MKISAMIGPAILIYGYIWVLIMAIAFEKNKLSRDTVAIVMAILALAWTILEK